MTPTPPLPPEVEEKLRVLANGDAEQLLVALIAYRMGLASAGDDVERLDELERMAREEPFMLHATLGSDGWPAKPRGLGINGCTLRAACDYMLKHRRSSAARKEPR